MAIIPPPCCCQNCDDVFVPPTGCFEVYAPGETPDTDDPIRWVILPYPTEYAYPSGSVVLSCNQLPTTRIIVRWGKEASCGPYGLYALTGAAGDTEEEMTVWPKSYNDLRWFETGGIGRFTIDGDEWLIRRCEGEYYFGEGVPPCLAIIEDEIGLQANLPNYWEGSDLCGFITNDEGSTPDTGAIVAGHFVIGWEVDPEQQNITVTYYSFVNEWSVTFAWTREWWTSDRTLTAADTTTRTLRACGTPCDVTTDCWPCPCVADGGTGNPVVIMFADVETPLWTETVSLVWNGSSYQYLSGGVPEKTVTLLCFDDDPIMYQLVVNDGTDEYSMSTTGALTCNGAETEMTDRTVTDGADTSVRLWTNNGGAGA